MLSNETDRPALLGSRGPLEGHRAFIRARSGPTAPKAVDRSLCLLGPDDCSAGSAQQVGTHVGQLMKPRARRRKRGPSKNPYSDITQACKDWHSAPNKVKRDAVFTKEIYPTFKRLAEFHFNNINKPGGIDRDTTINDVVSHMYEGLRTFVPSKAVTASNTQGLPWYFFNMIAMRESWKVIQQRATEVILRAASETLEVNDKYRGGALPWDMYEDNAPALDDVVESHIYDKLLAFDSELVTAITDLDDDCFTARQLRPAAREFLSQSLHGYVERRNLIKSSFLLCSSSIVGASP